MTTPGLIVEEQLPPTSKAKPWRLFLRQPWAQLSFHFRNVTYESLDDIYCSKFSTGCNPHVLGWRSQPCVSSLQIDVGCPVVIAAAIPHGRLATSCWPTFRQPPISYKACVYGWQRQASSFKSSNRLPPKRSRDFCSMASHEPGFESHRAYLGHVRPSYTGSAWMTASTLRLIPPVRHRMSCCDSCCHSRCNAASNWRMFCTGGSRA
jgi:hypothetical protein